MGRGPLAIRSHPRVAPGLGEAALPFLGVSCPRGNLITCDRVGIGVRVPRRALWVTVLLAGRRVALIPPQAGDNLWLGALDHAGLRRGPFDVHISRNAQYWYGDPAVWVHTRVFAYLAGSGVVSVSGAVELHAGFG